MSAKEKSKVEDTAKSDKAHYDAEMKNCVPPKGEKKGQKKDPNAPKRPPSAFFLFCSGHHPKTKSEHPGLPIGETAKNWVKCGLDSQPKISNHMNKSSWGKGKCEKEIAAHHAKGKSEAGKKGPGRPTGSKKKDEPEDEEEEEEEDEDGE